MDNMNNTNKIAKKLRRYKTVDDLPLTTVTKTTTAASMLSSTDINIQKNVNEAKVIKIKRLSNGETFNTTTAAATTTNYCATSTPKTALQQFYLNNQQRETNDSFTSVSTLDDNNNNCKVSSTKSSSTAVGKHHNNNNQLGLAKLYIIRDFYGSLIYGDLSVRQGEFVYLLCKSDSYYFVENQFGKYGFIPGEICVDLDEVRVNAQFKHSRSNSATQSKVTSF